MATFRILAVLAVLLPLVACGKCPAKLTKGQKARPTLTTKYSASYELSQLIGTLIVEEEYDSDTHRFAIKQHFVGSTITVFETGGTNPQLFQVLANRQCVEMQSKELFNLTMFQGLRRTTKLVQDKNVYLKFLVDLPSDYLIGYKGKVKQKDINMTVDDWQFCINGTMIDIYWTLEDAGTEAAAPFPVKITLSYPSTGEKENAYIFKYIANHVNESAIEPPAHVYCKGRHNDKVLDLKKYVSDQLSFTTEVVDQQRKQVFSMQHIYALDMGLTAIITPDVESKYPKEKINKIIYLFDLKIGYFFKLNTNAQTCEAHDLKSYDGLFGDIFQIFNGLVDSKDPERTLYYYTRKDIHRGLRTTVYKNFKANFPPGLSNTDSVVNWYMVKSDEDQVVVPAAVQLFTVMNNDPSNKIIGKYTYDIYNWRKQKYEFQNHYEFSASRCSPQYVRYQVSLNVSVKGYRYRKDFRKEFTLALSKSADISILRVIYPSLYGPSDTAGVHVAKFYMLEQFTNVQPSNSTIAVAVKKLQTVVDAGQFSFVIPLTEGNTTLTGVTNSLILVQNAEDEMLENFQTQRNEQTHE